MRILHYCDKDTDGGAAMAAYRLHRSLREAGHSSSMIVHRKTSVDPDVSQARPPRSLGPVEYEFRRIANRLRGGKMKLPRASYTFNFNLDPDVDETGLTALPRENVDIVCLHWLSKLLNPRAIRAVYDHFKRPLVWITADQEPVTGGCHYSFGCDRFEESCGNCPQLEPRGDDDRSHRTWQDKKRYLADLPITFVAPTSWCADKIRRSSLFKHNRVEIIPYPIETTTFRPFDKQIARDLLGLPQDRKIAFFGSTYLEDRRKGMELLIEALKLASNSIDSNSLFLLVAGLNGDDILSRLPFQGKYTGLLRDEITLALAYQAADLFICPSTEDAGPMMISEALLCGTPVAAFNTGIAPDIIENYSNGYAARSGDPADLAHGITEILDAPNPEEFRRNARARAMELHHPKIVAEKHVELYCSIYPVEGRVVDVI